MGLKRNLGEKYSPIYFLASLGNGGMAVAFYVYLHFMVKHSKMLLTPGDESSKVTVPLATFEAIKAGLIHGNMPAKVMIAVALLGIVFFAVRHYFYLIWNLKELGFFKKTPAYAELIAGDKEITLAAIPLTLAMSINVIFVICGVFIPGLWNIVEYLFPMALIGFLVVGIYALKIFVTFMSRILATGDFDCAENNSLSQMIAVFAFSMVSVGFAAPGAMSNNALTSALGIIGSMFFLSAAVLIGLQSLFLGFRAMMQHGINKENSPTLWIVIPILTLLGISIVRVDHGLHMNLHVHTQPGEMFINLIFLISLQIIFAAMGWHVMKQVNYFEEYINGDKKSANSYALICPGVAFFVFGFFVLQMGLVRMGVVPKFGIAYFILLSGLIFIQLKTIIMIFKLDKKLLFD